VNLGQKEIAMNQLSNMNTLAVPVNTSDHMLGSQNANVTLVEYGDFECPSCGQAYHAVKILLKHFGERVRFVFRHYPLREIHPHAELAAEAAEAAGAQKKFWPMHDLLFENQHHLKPHALRGYAERLELDLERFDADLRDETYLQRIREHQESGRRSGVRATPAFFVNSAIQDVSFGMQALESAVESALQRG
jgi:protein-disulfide isomerase